MDPNGSGRGADHTARLGLWLSFITLIVLPGAGMIWRTEERLDRVEATVRDAHLPESNDRLTRIERDVDWIRKDLERRR